MSSRSSDRTRSLVLDHVRAAGSISRVELAQLTGFTDATISSIVRAILDEGLVVENGFSESTGGKRRTLLAINSAARSAVGVSLARERISLVVTDLSGAAVSTAVLPGAGERSPDEVVATLAAEIGRAVEAAGVDPGSVVGVGVAGPGPLDASAGVLRGRQPSRSWNGFPLEERLGRETSLPVVLDNDATCAALGEHWIRRRRDTAPVAATVYMADGIGCGILIDGRVFHGSTSNAGEIGHISLDPEGPRCHCGSSGCVEMYASPAAIAGRALADERLVSSLALAREMPVRDVFDAVAGAAGRGDAASRALLLDAAAALGRGVVALANILDLDEVSLAGPAFAIAPELWVAGVQEALDEGTFMRRVHSVRVVASRLGAEAAALGAAALILQREVTPHSVAARHAARV